MSLDMLDMKSIESLEDLGKSLKHYREQKGFSIEQIQKYTKIRSKFIYAIEKGDFSLIPGGDVYVRGFLKNYVEAIGLDSEKVLQQYKMLTTKTDDIDNNTEASEEENTEKSHIKFLPNMTIVLVIALIIMIIVFIIRANKAPVGDPQKPPINHETILEEDASDKEDEKPTPKEPIEEETKNISVDIVDDTWEKTTYIVRDKHIEVTVDVNDRCWLSVKKDGSNDYEGILNKGDQKVFTAKQDLIIRIGNPMSVNISINGEDFGIPGGKARNFIFKREDS